MASLAKETRIMLAAEKLFTSRRFHEVTLDQVARDACVGKGTIYRYFKNKDDLFLRVTMSGFDDLCALIERTASRQVPFEKQLERILRDIGELYLRKRRLFRLIHTEGSRVPFMHRSMRSPWMKRRKKLHATVSDWLRRGVDTGCVRKDIPVETISACLFGMLRGFLSRADAKNRKAPPFADLIALFLRGAAGKREGLK